MDKNIKRAHTHTSRGEKSVERFNEVMIYGIYEIRWQLESVVRS